MRIFSLVIWILIVGLIGTADIFAQNLPTDLVKARVDRREAMIKGDGAVFDRLTSTNYISYDQTGRVETKAQRASRLQPPATPPQGPIAPPDRLNEHISMFNNDSVVFFWQQRTPQGLGNFMETWVKENGQWKCAGSAFSLPVVAQAPGSSPEGVGRRGRN
jgi:uncharacterized protein DUF4440